MVLGAELVSELKTVAQTLALPAISEPSAELVERLQRVPDLLNFGVVQSAGRLAFYNRWLAAGGDVPQIYSL